MVLPAAGTPKERASGKRAAPGALGSRGSAGWASCGREDCAARRSESGALHLCVPPAAAAPPAARARGVRPDRSPAWAAGARREGAPPGLQASSARVPEPSPR